jgi:hypothetical protein
MYHSGNALREHEEQAIPSNSLVRDLLNEFSDYGYFALAMLLFNPPQQRKN